MIHIEESTFQAKTIDECLLQAEKKYGISREVFKFTVVQEPREGFLGLGKKEAIVKLSAGDYPDGSSDEDSNESKEVSDESIAKPEVSSETVETEVVEEVKTTESALENTDNLKKELDTPTEIPPVVYKASEYIVSILENMGIKDVKVKIEPMAGGVTFYLDNDSPNKGDIIGRRGEVLDSLQYLASVFVNRDMEDYFRINIDSNGFREKRKKTLQILASKAAKSACRTGKDKSFEPMNPYERRIIHSVIAELDNVSSHSVGEEPYRRVIVTCTNPKKPNYNKKRRNNNGKYNKNHRGRNGYKRDENYVPKPKSMDSMKTSFEKEYSKPKPEDSIEGGLYGKIEL